MNSIFLATVIRLRYESVQVINLIAFGDSWKL